MAILLAAAIIAGLLSLYYALSRQWKPMSIAGIIALTGFWLNRQVETIPQEFVTVFPNVATLIVLTFLAQRLTPPAMAGMPYRRGSE
jgi:ABC-type uncharacterized transport system permease subunit